MSECGGDIEIEEDQDNAKNMDDIIEGTSKGVVKGSVFLKYFQSGSSLGITFIMAVLFILTQILVSLNDYCVPYM